ncbi:aminotransferase class I/II-fold pyridoxal phosphate-dependent enzyme [Amylibacter sp. SFDW26]|uniref:DegT/DnrJ/EryC1/StrS family aminotransferase n=1 Tax=Amylibacter sp. SFDW26 TaxID=2652722 RepID=UPI00126270A6|nr:aminotransferase class I/II-fold pyridoxal phosphate-dependent enzyme [Amylibacter sp. SFDW26]KAB7609844.1 aminotransferase class I/II-fold pyridoxal phosphate-dependent enzyme [Amylibacter sp. SFDW26]
MRIWLSKPHMSGREREYVSEAFDSNFVAPLGPQLNAFEKSVSDYLGGHVHCVGLSSGSAALHLALRLVGVNKDDEVWISSMTFAGGIFPVLYQGAKPVFFDLDASSWTVYCDLLEEELKKANAKNALPKAIVPTDLYGQSVDLDPLEKMTNQYGVALVVDSAESLGSSYKKGRKCGTGGDVSILSFNGNKIITTSGGGMLVTHNEKIADEARFLATQARDNAPHYEHSTYGYNYRLSNICAGIGLGQMEVLDDRVARRREINARYRKELGRSGIQFMPEQKGCYSSQWLTAATFDEDILGVCRETIRLKLMQDEVETRPLWKPMHMQPLFEGTHYIGSGFDEALFANGLCLPSGSCLTEAEQTEVIERILDIIDQA